MVYHHAYALVSNNQINNIIIAESILDADKIARISYSDGVAICCDNYKCHIGDFYEDGKFYRQIEGGNKQEILYDTTDEEIILNLKLVIKELRDRLKELSE